MRIAIYGAGNYGQYVYNEINNHERTQISVAFWIDNFAKEQKRFGLPIYTVEAFFKMRKSEDVDGVVVAIDVPSIAYKAAISLLSQGYKQVYLTWPRGFIPQVPILDEEGAFGPFIKYHNLFEELKPTIPHVEIAVTNYCNLNCKRCGNFSNLVTQMDYLDLNIFERDLMQLSKKIKNITIFSVLGGEPLLYPKLDVCIKLINKYFPGTYIQIVTNGLLIPNIPLNLIEAIKRYNAHFYISQYVPTRKMLPRIIEFLEKEQICYEITPPRTEFRKMLSFKDDDIERAFQYNAADQCTCHSINNGRIYLCSNFHRLYTMQEYFGIHIEEAELKGNSVDLSDDSVDGWDILEYFRHPVSLCRFCNPEDLWVPWETGAHQKDDWIAD